MEIKMLLRYYRLHNLHLCILLWPLLFLPFSVKAGCYTPTLSHTCTASDLNGSTSGPCSCPEPAKKGPVLCPRLEGIQMPCLQRLATTSCTYIGDQVCVPDPTPTPTPMPPCQKLKYCTSTDQVCTQYEQRTCTRTVTEQGPCLAYSEAGSCLQYSTTTRTESYTCNGSCLNTETRTSTYVCGCDD
jgi:hypothetical protein